MAFPPKSCMHSSSAPCPAPLFLHDLIILYLTKTIRYEVSPLFGRKYSPQHPLLKVVKKTVKEKRLAEKYGEIR
jgi:hypothetical protein